jgi:hypothetical protein
MEHNLACVLSHKKIQHYVRLILLPFFDQLTDEEKLYVHVMQDNAVIHTANSSVG